MKMPGASKLLNDDLNFDFDRTSTTTLFFKNQEEIEQQKHKMIKNQIKEFNELIDNRHSAMSTKINPTS